MNVPMRKSCPRFSPPFLPLWRSVLLAASLLFCACPRAQNDPNAPNQAAKPAELPKDPNELVDFLAKESLEAQLQFSPSMATWLGDHRYDFALEDGRA